MHQPHTTSAQIRRKRLPHYYKFGRERQPGREGLRISVVAPQEED